MSDDTDKAEELLQQSKDQSRHTSEPATADERTHDRVATIKNALLAIDRGDIPENINIRDERLKALLVGLDHANDLQAVVDELVDVTDGDPIDDPTQSDAARLLIRAALHEVLPEVLEDAIEANQQAHLERGSDF